MANPPSNPQGGLVGPTTQIQNIVKAQCRPNQEFSQGLCYVKCKDGHEGVGSLCYQNCPTTGQFLNLGPVCQKVPLPSQTGVVPVIRPCPSGMIDNGRDCISELNCAWPNQCVGTGLPSILFKDRLQCAKGTQDLVGGLCQPKCPSGYSRAGDTCTPQCPKGFFDMKPDGTDNHCVKPTYGRGIGLSPPFTPLAEIAQNPNGSTLLQRYRVGQTPQSTAAANTSNFFGSPLGDPSSSTSGNGLTGNNSSSGSWIGSIFSDIINLISNLLNSVFGITPQADPIQWIIGVLIVLVALFYVSPQIAILFTRGIEAGGKLFAGVEKTAAGIIKSTEEAAGTVVEGAETAVGNVVSTGGKAVGTAVSGIAQGVGTAASGIAQGTGTAISGAAKGIGTAASGIIQGAQEAGSQLAVSTIKEFNPLATQTRTSSNLETRGSNRPEFVPSGKPLGTVGYQGEPPVPSEAPSMAAGQKSWISRLSPELRSQLLSLILSDS